MAEKGAKGKLYDVAFRMYTADGKSLTEIADALGVSRQSVAAWKAETRRGSEEHDDWDRARQQKRTNVQRLRDLFERELTALETSQAGSLSAGSLDAITKLGTLVQRWEQAGAAPAYDRPRVFLENLQFIIGWLREHDPAGLAVLAESFDPLTTAFKEQGHGSSNA
ncbi:DUF1804 family protein [Chrysiogenes arsenatis]|uniref:DUF1804 family protein n=1 Tax=Chrysiogenes arsenatis TaxID=309797 RepID=UPI0003FFED32|nr:DUF1804 family protein [Chrysiogenes arsenatis]